MLELLQNVRPIGLAYARSLYRRIRGRNGLDTGGPYPVKLLRQVEIRPDRLEPYLALTDGSDLGFGEKGRLPPLYFTLWGLRPYWEVLGSDALSLDVVGIIHAQNDVIVHRPLRMSDRVDCRISVGRIFRDERRALVTICAECMVSGEVCVEASTVLLSVTGSRETLIPPADPVSDTDPGWREIRRFYFGEDHGRRYGMLTGDLNPIHLHSLGSRLFGFARPIAHGFSLKAMVAHALIRSEAAGDSERLARVRMRFMAPIPLPGGAVCQVSGKRFRVLNAAGDRLVATGRFRVQ